MLRNDLMADGFVHRSAVVPRGRLDAVGAAIDADLVANYDPARLDEYDNRSSCPALRSTALIADLLATTPARALVEETLGWDRVAIDDGQIAIRQAHRVAAPEPPQPHIDGIPTASNGMVGHYLHTFTALVGIFLTETPGTDAGNFTVWPGSHHTIAGWYRERGPTSIFQPQLPPVDLGEPVQLITRPGDVVLCAYALAHAAAANASAVERRAVFYRVRFTDLWRPDRRWRCLIDPFDGWRLDPPPAGTGGSA